MLIRNKQLRIQVIMFVIIVSMTITNIANTYSVSHDFSHFRVIHLMLFLACGMLLGAIITRIRLLYFPKEKTN